MARHLRSCIVLLPDYDLVRIYHPDSIVNRSVAPETAQARFQSISAAYDVLRGKRRVMTNHTDSEDPVPGSVHDYHELSTAMWRAKQRRRATLNIGIDERWKERLFFGAVLLVWNAYCLTQTRSSYSLFYSVDYRRIRCPNVFDTSTSFDIGP